MHEPTERPWIGRSLAWGAVFAAILAAWAWTLMMAAMMGADWLGRPVGPSMMPVHGPGALVTMWLVMMAAMMLPVMVPALAAYEALIARSNATRGGWWGVLGGYLGVWLGAGALLALAQWSLLRAGAVDVMGAATARWASATLMIGAGAYQFTHAKEVCHGRCHAPTLYFLGRWRTGARGGLRMGAGLGAWCVACCWGFMALGFAGGTMSVLWMAGATALMVLEKLPQIGRRTLRPVGAALILGGILLALG